MTKLSTNLVTATIDACLAQDAPADEAGHKKFCEDNYDVYSSLLYSYIGLCTDLLPANMVKKVCSEIGERGLLWLNNRLSDVYEYIMNGKYDGNHDVFTSSALYILNRDLGYNLQGMDECINVADVQNFLQFTKRVCPYGYAPDGLHKWFANQERLATFSADYHKFESKSCWSLIDELIKDNISRICDTVRDEIESNINAALSSFESLPWLYLPTGDTLERDKCRLEKFVTLNKELSNPTQVRFSDSIGTFPRIPEHVLIEGLTDPDTFKFAETQKVCKYILDKYFDTDKTETIRFSRITQVPKTFKEPRIIGIESVSTSVICKLIAEPLTRALTNYTNGRCDLSDQGLNRDLCVQAVTRELDTIDLSMASDSISNVVIELFPGWLQELLDKYVSHVALIEHNMNDLPHVVHLATYLTMGSTLTPVMQTIFYTSVVLATAEAEKFYASFFDNGKLGRQLKKLDKEFDSFPYAVYNDDIITQSNITAPVIDVLEHYGFLVNERKTHAGNERVYFAIPGMTYRESCGIQVLRYENTVYAYEGLYYSRKPLERGLAGVRQIIALQHRIAKDFSRYTNMNDAVTSWLKDRIPEITESDINSGYEDIWSPNPAYTMVKCPYVSVAGDVTSKLDTNTSHERDGHLTFRSKVTKRCSTNGNTGKARAVLQYVSALFSGPRFDGPLEELLNVTTPINRDDDITLECEVEAKVE